MFESIATVVTRRAWIVLLLWAGLVGLLWAVAPPWETVSRDDNVKFFPPHFSSVLGQDLLERGFPHDASSSEAVIIAERPRGPLTEQDKAFVAGLSDRLRGQIPDPVPPGEPVWKKVTDYRELLIGPRLIGGTGADGSGQAVLTFVSINATYSSKLARRTVDRLEQELAALRPQAPAGLQLMMTGSAVVGHDTNAASSASLNNTTYATIFLVVAILLVVYRSPLLALIPLVTIGLSVWASLMAIPLLTYLPGLEFQVISITRLFVIVVLFGAGTDYCLFLIARYREELARGRRGDEALREAIGQVGGALLASAGTVIVGLGMLWFSTFAKIQYTGPSIALSLAVALAAAVTLAPVLLHWLRGAVFWPFPTPHHSRGADPDAETQAETPMHGFWA
ncbi:MAG TPA: MMPL family transporter, partial [Isosphaeraceae bacterium]